MCARVHRYTTSEQSDCAARPRRPPRPRPHPRPCPWTFSSFSFQSLHRLPLQQAGRGGDGERATFIRLERKAGGGLEVADQRVRNTAGRSRARGDLDAGIASAHPGRHPRLGLRSTRAAAAHPSKCTAVFLAVRILVSVEDARPRTSEVAELLRRCLGAVPLLRPLEHDLLLFLLLQGWVEAHLRW